MRNARVFPEPVRAAPRTSRPASRGGMVRACTSVICVYPSSAMPAMVFLDKPSESKVLSLRMPSTCTVMRSPSAGRASSSGLSPALPLLFFLAGFASLSLSSPSLASPALSSSSSESFAAAAAAAAAAFFAIFRSLTLMPEPSSSASSRSRFLTADFIFFFRARSALSSSADMPEEPMVTAS